MTIASTLSRWEYDGDGSTVTFPYTNKIFVDADLNVYVDAVLQTLDTDYTVTGAGDDNGSVVFVTAPADNTDIVIVRSLTDNQLTDLPEGGAFPASSVEDMSDRRTIISQQQQEEIDRSLKKTVTGTNYDAGSLTIENLAAPTGDSDAATKAYADATAASAGDGTLAASLTELTNLAGLQGVSVSGLTGGETRYMKGRSTVGDGGEGKFIWRTGDQSTNVTNDEVTASGGNGGIWIAPTSDLTGAGGAWERIGWDHYDFRWYGAVLDGSTNDLNAFKAVSAVADAATLPIAAILPDDAIMAIDASADSDRVTWSNKLTVFSPKAQYDKAAPIILVNHADTYFFTEDASISEARASNFGINGIEIKGYNTGTTNRWDDDTTGGERNVTELWLVHDAQPQIKGKLRNAATLLHTVSTRAGNFPEQIDLVGRVADYTVAWLVDESGSGTGSHEHANVDLFISQGKKTGVPDTAIKIQNGASLYRSNVKLRGRGDGDGSITGTHDGSSNSATLSDSGASFTTNALVGLVVENTTDGSRGVITANTTTTITATLSGGTENDWDSGDSYEVRSAVIWATNSGSTFTNNTRVDIALDRAVTTDILRASDSAQVSRNYGFINGATGSFSLPDGLSFQNSLWLLGQPGNEIRGASVSAFDNIWKKLITDIKSANPGDSVVVAHSVSGSMVANAVHGILPGRSFGDGTIINKFRLVAIHYYCGTAPTGNTNGGWEMQLVSSGAATTLRHIIPDSSTTGVITTDTGASLLAATDIPDGFFNNPIQLNSRGVSGGVRNDGTPPSDVFFNYVLAFVQ